MGDGHPAAHFLGTLESQRWEVNGNDAKEPYVLKAVLLAGLVLMNGIRRQDTGCAETGEE